MSVYVVVVLVEDLACIFSSVFADEIVGLRRL